MAEQSSLLSNSPLSENGTLEGIVFNIQRFTIHDGPGIRTEIFLKGCTLECLWCSNPESIRSSPEVAFHPARCLGTDICGQCQSVCELVDQGAFVIENGRLAGINHQVCNGCLACAENCPSEALSVYGKPMTVSQVLKLVLADRGYYGDRGGATFSGGEAFVQWRFLQACLKACREAGIHTCVESALNVPGQRILQLAPFIDLMIFDLKTMNERDHRTFTGGSTARIHDNIRLLAKLDMPVVARVPVVPGLNDSLENITATARFIRKELGDSVLQVQLLRYRPLGIEKYQSLGKTCPMTGIRMPDRSEAEARIRQLVEIMRDMDLPAVAGTTTPF
ncbi:glycyl-radical enzyme activating protein [bacterium]|nr:glycyl-radical enzyme activating protein [bacterium]